MSFGGDEGPFKGAWRQMLRVEYERNKDLRRDEYVMNGRFGPYVQLGSESPKGTKLKDRIKAKKSSVPKDKKLEEVTIADALHYLSLPRELGVHPEPQKMISANIGRFGPYIVHDTDFRSLKTDDVYHITFERALEILKEPKKIESFWSISVRESNIIPT